MTDIDELYSDVFQIPLTSIKKTPVKKRNPSLFKPCQGSALERCVDENSIDIYSDMSLDGNSPHKMTPSLLKPTEKNCRPLSEDHVQDMNDNLDLYTEVMTSELTEKTNQELNRLRLENEKLLAENQKLKSLKDQLNKNISSLFLTARKELQKKEEEIHTLRKLIEEQSKMNKDKSRATYSCTVCEVKQTSSCSHKDDTLDKRKQSFPDKTKHVTDRGSSNRETVENVIVSSSSANANSSASLKTIPISSKKSLSEDKNPTNHKDKTVHLTDLRNKIVSSQQEYGMKESKSKPKHSDSKKNEDQIDTVSHKQNEKVSSFTDRKEKSDAKHKTLNEPSIKNSSSNASRTSISDSERVSQKNAKSQPSQSKSKQPTAIVVEGTGPAKDGAAQILTKAAKPANQTLGSCVEKQKSQPAKQNERVQSGHMNEKPDNAEESSLSSGKCKDSTNLLDLRHLLKSHRVNGHQSTELRSGDSLGNKAEPAQNSLEKLETSKTKLDNCIDQSMKRKNKDSYLVRESEVKKTCIESPPLKKKKGAEHEEPSQGVLSKVVSNEATSNKVVSETAHKVASNATSNKVTANVTSNKVTANVTSNKVASETAITVASNATSNKVTANVTSNKVTANVTSNKVTANVTSNKVASETAFKVASNATFNKVTANVTSNKVTANVTSNKVASETAITVASNATSNKVTANVTSIKVASNANFNKVTANVTSNKVAYETTMKVASETAIITASNATSNKATANVTSNKATANVTSNKGVTETTNKATSETFNKVSSKATSKKVVSVTETANKATSETFNKVSSKATSKKVVNETENKVASNATSIKVVNKVASETTIKVASNATPNKVASSATSDKVVSKTCETAKKVISKATSNKCVSETANKVVSNDACNKVSVINETSNSSCTNQTWPFQITSNFHAENSKDAFNEISDSSAHIDSKIKCDRAFPIDKVPTVSQTSQGSENLSSSFVDIEAVGDEEEANCNNNGNQNSILICLGEERKKVQTQSGIVSADDMKTLSSVQPTQPGRSCSEDSEPESHSPLPFSSFATKKARGKSDDSNDSEKASSNSSAMYTDSDKLSLSSEEFPKEQRVRPLESPVPFATSITCASNLILLGDEETTCTTFVSPGKPSYLPSEFYPPGVRAPVQEEASHARHIRGPLEVIQKSRAGLSHKDSETSCTLNSTEPEYFASQLNLPDTDAGNKDILKEPHADDLMKLQKMKAHCYPGAKKQFEYLTKDTLNSWTSFVEQKFYQVFHKELKTFKEGNVLIAQSASKMDKRRKARILEKKSDWIRRGREQSLITYSIGNSSVLQRNPQDNCSVFSTVPAFRDSVNQSVHEAESESKVPKAMSFKSGNETIGSVHSADNIITPNIRPHLVEQTRSSPDSWVVTSSGNETIINHLSEISAPVQKCSSTDEPDSTCEYKSKYLSEANGSIHETRDEDVLGEKQNVFDQEENSSDIHLYLSADELQEETADENESTKISTSVSPYKDSRYIKTSSPIQARHDSVFSSVRKDHQVVVPRLSADSVLNTTFTVSNGDSSSGEERHDIPNARDAKHFGRVVPPEEISLMEASLSEFDADVRNTPSRQRKQLLGASPLSFKNKLNLKNVCSSPKFVISPFKSHREHTKDVGIKVGCLRIHETLQTANSIMPATTNICTESETIVCSRHKTFQELKDNMCVKNTYVFVLRTSDESDQDSQGSDKQTKEMFSNEGSRAGLNEEETEFIMTVQRVKKKLDLDSAVACGSVNQSPVIHVSDSLTSPPYRQNISETPLESDGKLTEDPKESGIAQISKFVNSSKADTEDVEEGEILENSLENKLKERVKEKNSNKSDSHKVGNKKCSDPKFIEKRNVESRNTQISTSRKDSDSMKIRNDGYRNAQASKSEIPLDKSSRLHPKLMDNQLSSSKHSKSTAERNNESGRIRKRSRSRSREPARDHKYRRNESGQRLSLETSDNGTRHEREKRRDERRSREFRESDRELQERRKYSERDRDRKYPSPVDAYLHKHPSKENKHRSSSRYE